MWLIFTYSLPASNPNGRVRIWRKLLSIGALQLKSSFYILPMNDTNFEHLEWTTGEVEEIGGEAIFFKSDRIENIEDKEIKAMFNSDRVRDYLRLEEKIRKFAAGLLDKDISEGTVESELKNGLKRLTKEFNSIKEIDFFASERAEKTVKLLESLSNRLKSLKGKEGAKSLESLNIKEYKGKVWVTRKRPFVDRMASYWLIKRFIDNKARVCFISATDVKTKAKKDVVSFDVKGGDFTHKGNLVTFEVIARSFGINDRGVEYIGRIVHSIDLKDYAYYSEESKGVEVVIKGIIKTSKEWWSFQPRLDSSFVF